MTSYRFLGRTFTCHCGREFHPWNKNQKFCSKKCARASHKWPAQEETDFIGWWNSDRPMTEVVSLTGRTRNAVIGKANRLRNDGIQMRSRKSDNRRYDYIDMNGERTDRPYSKSYMRQHKITSNDGTRAIRVDRVSLPLLASLSVPLPEIDI